MMEPTPDDPNAALRRDVKTLGGILGEVIRQQAGEAVFAQVEDVRRLAKAARAGDDSAFQQLSTTLSQLSPADSLAITRAFSHFLTLANIAEQYHRIRRRHWHLRTPSSPPQQGSFGETLARLKYQGATDAELFAAVQALDIGLVLTAHPTEIARRTLLQTNNRISEALRQLDQPGKAPVQEEELLTTIRREITLSWLTDEIHRERPTPHHEATSGLLVFEQSLWKALPRVLRQLSRELHSATGRTLPLDCTPVRFGSWMGGDRDGNPNVTSSVTRHVCVLARWLAADLYLKDVIELRAELAIMHGSDELAAQLSSASSEPYRDFLDGVRQKLQNTRDYLGSLLRSEVPQIKQEDIYHNSEDLRTPLLLCHRSLLATGAAILAAGRLEDIIRRLYAFGLSLVRLDIRQEASRHTELLGEVTRALGLGAYDEWSETQRQEFLSRELANKRPLVPRHLALSAPAQEVWETLLALADIAPESLGAYVISMASTPSDVLAVELLQREAGVTPPLPVVPLFEQVAALRTAADCMRRLLQVPGYKERLSGVQEVMLGYSDSAKDAGRLAADWELYKTQEQLVLVCAEADIKLRLFHGRGGSAARGGAPTTLAFQSQPPGATQGSLRVTEQGEMIQAKFGLPGIAERTLEVYITATLEACLTPPRAPEAGWRSLMDELAATAQQAYRGLVAEDPSFIEYFTKATPQEELGELNIGSRPARRKALTGIASLRAIPWVFAWTQTRLMLPSWLGFDAAMQQATQNQRLGELQQMYRDWPFFRSCVSLVEMVLAKADPGIAVRYDERLAPTHLLPLGNALRRRLHEATVGVLQVTGHRVLLEDNAVLDRSIAVRNPYVDPLNIMQIEALHRRRRHGGELPQVLHDMLLITFNGIAAGMRNTG